MNINQAYQILNYGTGPKTREQQLHLLRIMNYTKVAGAKSLLRASDQQVYLVARKLFRAAEKKVRRFWEAVEEEEKREEQITFPFQYHAFLCDIFNIPEELRDTVTISELEDELQK